MKKITLLLTLFSLQAFARPEISIPEEVEISQHEILRLGDIAKVKEGSEELVTFLDGIVIRDDARGLLLNQFLPSSEVLAKFRQALTAEPRLRAMNPQFKVPSQVKVNVSPVPVSRQEVTRKILNILDARCNECEHLVNIQSTPRPYGKTWDLDFSKLAAKGGFLLPLRDGESNQNKWVSGTIRVSRLTPVTTRLILQNERVQEGDLELKMTDVTFAKDSVLRKEDVHGQLSIRSLPVGSPVWASDLKREPAAQRGQMVKAVIGDGDFEVSVNMLAEDNGFVGDLIKVKNLDNKKILSGLVTEKGVVKLQ